MQRRRHRIRPFHLIAAVACVAAGCATTPPAPAQPKAPAPRPTPDVYFYPLGNQSAEQQDRDRYECYLWARKETGYDPSQPGENGGPPLRVVAMPAPGHDTTAGAVAGAVIGSAVSEPWHAAEGAAVGAMAGAVIGAASDVSRQQQAQQEQARLDAERDRTIAQADARVLDYRNAMKSCLAARGYSVQ